MIASLISWWRALSLREQRLIAVMLALAGGILVWLGLFVPLRDGLAQAHADHAAAIERNAAIRAGVAVLRESRGGAPSVSGSLDQRVAASAAEAGFTLDANMAAGAEMTAITIATARAPALLAWLDQLEQQGIGIEALQLQPAPNGNVAARVTLRVRKS